MKKFSIITICLNSESTIRRTIESVLSQGYENLEYIIIDGQSTDSTMDIINEYRGSIDVIVSEKDQGISDAFNKGIKLANGDYIGIINSDDFLAKNCLHILNSSMDEAADVVYGNLILHGTDGDTRLLKPGKMDELSKKMPLFHPATIVKKTAYEKYGLFDISFKYAMDRELLLRMYTKGAKFQYIDETIAHFSMGGLSEKNYINGELPENAKASLMYGRNIWKVRMDSFSNAIKYEISHALRRNIVGKKILKVYHRKEFTGDD